MKEKKNATKIVGSAVLGLDFRVVMVAGRRYVIQPPTIARIAGAGIFLADLAEAETIKDFLLQQTDLANVSTALSYMICGSEELTEELSKGTLTEVVDALTEAYSLLSVQDFTRLSALARNVGKMIVNQKQ